MYKCVQKDDGSRNALDEFMKNRNENMLEVVKFCSAHTQYWKGRVFLELLWEYERRQENALAEHVTDPNGDGT